MVKINVEELQETQGAASFLAEPEPKHDVAPAVNSHV
jgi:hypothetical protein